MKKILLLVDIQKEYSTKGRPFYINGIEKSLINAKNILDYARENDWEIIHVEHIQDGENFSLKSEYSQFIEGFEPRRGEVVYIKSKSSCYSNKYFTQYFEKLKEREVVVVGCTATNCIISTIIEGHQMGNRFVFVKDLINSRLETEKNEVEMYEAMNLLSNYSRVVSAEELM